MSLYNVINIASSAVSAQNIRLDTISSNIANADTVGNDENLPYRAKQPVFATYMNNITGSGLGPQVNTTMGGVRVESIQESDLPFPREYNPTHPQAGADGYILRPNVNLIHEIKNLQDTGTSIDANIKVMETAKRMALKTLSLGD